MSSPSAHASVEPVQAKTTRADGEFKNERNHSAKRRWQPTEKPWKVTGKRTKRERKMGEGSSDEVLKKDIQAILREHADAFTNDPEGNPLPEDIPAPDTEVDLQILDVSSTGDGLAMRKGSSQVYTVPFTVAGDTIRAKVHRHRLDEQHTIADFVSVITPAPSRDDSRIRCKYFASCGGCQLQMLDYEDQLAYKRRVVSKAFRNFSNLDPGLLPDVLETMGSPLQYGYRTKLTPHFDGPPGQPRRKDRPGVSFEKLPDIGFMRKGTRSVLDIEDCPIGTDVVRKGMKRERGRMEKEYTKYQRGATILLRESTKRFPKDEAPKEDPAPDTVMVETDSHVDIKTCITNNHATSTEYIGTNAFTNPAGSFFQNNNSILPPFIDYVRTHILPPPSAASRPIKHLIDAYSGSGLFTIMLSSLFSHSTGIDIAADSIASAHSNARLNGLSKERCTFIAADAGELFKSVAYDPEETVVVLDPPRKGCDGDFLAQLRRFGPRRVLYVSCNVHSQARDVGVLVRGEGEGARYAVESLRGLDFFPQTAHVEGVAILNRVDDTAS